MPTPRFATNDDTELARLLKLKDERYVLRFNPLGPGPLPPLDRGGPALGR